ncbi:hypothetical protein MTO96_043051 [Rhipicephalus appendiculatus]
MVLEEDRARSGQRWTRQGVIFRGSSVGYLIPCTSSDGRLCDIFRHVHLWNEHFLQVGLELKELSPGELSLADIRDPLVPWANDGYVPRETAQHVHEAVTLLHHLFTLHRCVVSVCLNSCIVAGHFQLVCDALLKGPNLRKLTLCLLHLKVQTSHSLATALPHLEEPAGA